MAATWSLQGRVQVGLGGQELVLFIYSLDKHLSSTLMCQALCKARGGGVA